MPDEMRCSLLLASLCLPLISLLPRSAEACIPGDECNISDKWQHLELITTNVGTDGVLLFDGRRGHEGGTMSDADALQYLHAEVLADGQPIAGAFAVVDGWPGVIWRPDAPLPAGASLSVSVSVDNEQVPDEAGCIVSELDLGPLPVQVSDGPTPALDDVSFNATSTYFVEPAIELDSLVCCDEAYPQAYEECGTVVGWSAGKCAATKGRGRLATEWTVDLEQLPAELAGSVSWKIVAGDGDHPAHASAKVWSVHGEQVICAHIEVRNHVTGDVLALEEQCFGEEHADELGLIDLDASTELEGVCTDQPYVCEVDGDAWDPNACEPYEDDGDGGDGDGDNGTEGGEPGLDDQDAKGCSVAARSPSPWLGAGLLLLAFVRRRRD